MANIKSAIKRIKQSEKRRQRNRAARSSVRSAVKSARAALEAGGAGATSLVQGAIRTLDKAVTRGAIHRNTAARQKSSLARRLAAVP